MSALEPLRPFSPPRAAPPPDQHVTVGRDLPQPES